MKEICDVLDIAKSTLYSYLKQREETDGGVKVEKGKVRPPSRTFP